MRQSKVLSNFVVLSIFCIFMITIVPICTIDTVSLKPVLQTAETDRIDVVEEYVVTSASEEPTPRNDAAMAYDSESDRLIMVGGWSDELNGWPGTWAYDANVDKWTNMSPATSPPPGFATGQMAYDTASDRIILYGGGLEAAPYFSHQTWAYDFNSNSWTNMTTVTNPGDLYSGSMAYDSESDVIILFGGITYAGLEPQAYINETWAYDFDSNTWTNMTTTNQPLMRQFAGFAYDSESDRVILFGGWGPDENYDDTWSYDYNSNTWTQLSPATSPSARYCGDMAYDSGSDRAILFGGVDRTDNGFADTWSYDYNLDTWTQMSPEPHPTDRERHRLAYDAESDLVILFGGIEGGTVWDPVFREDIVWTYNYESNLWIYSGWDWVNMNPTTSPGTRCGSPLVYDIESDRMVLFSGWPDLHDDGTRYNDTWTYDYDTNTWTNMSPPVLPSGRGGHAMAYYEEADVMVMFGGVTGWQSDDEKYMADTWTYDLNTNTWTNMSPTNYPTPRIYASMGYDNESDVIVMFGGFMEDHSAGHETWIYNLTSNTWTNATTVSHPEARFFGSLFFDYDGNRVLLGGGGNWVGYTNDLWEYNYGANTWTELIPANAPPSFGFALTYDLESELIVSNGGPIDLNEDVFVRETWTFNLTAMQWNNSYSQYNPDERSRHFLAYDIESDRTIIYGGALPEGNQGEALGDTWAYDYKVNPPGLGQIQNLEVTPIENRLVLTWDPPIDGSGLAVIGYNVYKGSQVGVHTLLKELGNVLTYTDLTAGFNITYYYTVAAISIIGEGEISDEVSGILPFVPDDDEIYTFIAYGDTRSSDETSVSPIHDDLVSIFLQRSDPELIIHTGDMVNHGGETYQWPLFDDSISAIYEWDANMKFYGAVGNHEWYTDIWGVNDDDFSNYLDYFDFSDVINEAGESELWYSFDWNDIHFIFLSTVEGWIGDDFTCPTTQMDWLMSDLAGNDEFIVVSMHNPSYSIRADRPDRWAQAESVRAAFHDIFIDYEVDIVFAGHDHQYYRTIRDGIQYVVTGGGGAPLYDIQTTGTVWQTGDIGFSDYHYCVGTIESSLLTIEVFLMDGTSMDAFSLPLPTTTISTTPTTTTPPPPPPPPMVLILIASGAVVVVILLVVIFRKRE